MNLLGKVFSFLSPRAAPELREPTAAPSPLSTRDSNRVKKPKAGNARQQEVRRKRLANAALRELNNGVSSPSRRSSTGGGNWDGEVDDIMPKTDTSRGSSEHFNSRQSIGEAQEDQVETSQRDDHEINLAYDFASEYFSSDSSEAHKVSLTGGKQESNPGSGVTATEEAMDDVVGQDKEAQWTLTGLRGHRWNDGEIEVEVDWQGGESTWEPERNIHLDAPQMLFEYWERQGGRPTNPDDPEMFDIVAIRSHTKRRLLVEWTGYPPSENTWMDRKEVRATAPDVVKEYFEGLKK